MSSVRCGFCGLGKLGLPVALALDSYGFDVCGTDVNRDIVGYIFNRKIPYKEELADDLLKTHNITFYGDVGDVIRSSDVIFMPIQTPHEERYEGTTRLPPERKDFDYSFLIQAVKDFANALSLSSDPSPKTLVIISTVLPGTIRREILPIIEKDKRINLVYNPFFIAMGTTIHDFLNPEFVLLGMDEGANWENLKAIYRELYHRRSEEYVLKGSIRFFQVMSIESAELTKVAYNTFITSKICIVNTLMEICHKTPGANIDDVTGALKNATKRIVSTAYMTGGMGDGGGCHPRDNIAMSCLAKSLNLSYDWFENLMISREKQAEFFVDLIVTEYEKGDLVVILGYTFKPETNLIVGSHALLVAEMLKESGMYYMIFNKYQADQLYNQFGKLIIFIGCKNPEFNDIDFVSGTIVIDPFRYIPDQTGVKVIRIGE